MKFFGKLTFICALAASTLLFTQCKQDTAMDVDSTVEECIGKVKATIASIDNPNDLPRNIYPGQTEWNTVDMHDWTSGFWPGVLWYAYELTEDPEILKSAQAFTEPLEGILDVPVANHDLGFMLFCSYGNGYRLTQNKAYRDVILEAADSLATLYNPKVGTILSWPEMVEKKGWAHNTIIDNMINLEMLFWASKNGGSQRLYDIAVKHAQVSMTTLVRPDYSTYHVAVFDTVTGDFLKGVTHQGYADDSQWARGQGWGVYGYAMCYRETGRTEFLDMSKNLADKFISRMTEDIIPAWDLDDPDPKAPKDASAAGVLASGMLELASYVEDADEKAKYYNTAVSLLTKMASTEYMSGEENLSMLLHSTGHKPNGSEIDASIIYADYYFLEALLRLKKWDGKRVVF